MPLKLGQANNHLFQWTVKNTRTQNRATEVNNHDATNRRNIPSRYSLQGSLLVARPGRSVHLYGIPFQVCRLNVSKQVPHDCRCTGKLLRERPLTHQRSTNQSRDQALYFKGVCVCVCVCACVCYKGRGSLSNLETLHIYTQ
jgi:hypothetical protein